jgi:DNA repair protein RecO (recombination protein O)
MLKSRMPLRVAEAFILRTYPLKESDKIVSFFTREWGKRRGVARGARRPKSKFGSTLEPLTQVRVQYFEREGKELSTIDHCEAISSLMPTLTGPRGSLLHSVAVSLVVEVAERMLPDHEVNDTVFRLLLAVTGALRDPAGDAAWLALSYYLYWMVRLGGVLPQLSLGPEARALEEALARQPLPALGPEARAAAAASGGRELRRLLYAALTDHLEAPLRTWPMLLELDA